MNNYVLAVMVALCALALLWHFGMLPPLTDMYMIWLGDNPGYMTPGNPDKISFPSYPARTYSLDEYDNIVIYGSFYAWAWGNQDMIDMCDRLGGYVKTSGANTGACLFPDVAYLVSMIDYITDENGNVYDEFGVSGNEMVINENYGYIPASMTWYMKTSKPDPPPETCYDGIQNQDETGVDCGGVCPPCDVPPPPPPPPPDEFPYLIIISVAVLIGLVFIWRRLG